MASTHAFSVAEPTRGVEVRMSRRCSSSCPMKYCAELLAHGAVRWGRPEVILNRRRDVREGETAREIGPFETRSGGHVTLVPRDAVQTVGNRNVVYVPVEGGDGRFAERVVKLGAAREDSFEVLDGLKPGEFVVTAGSFFLRAEAGRTRSGG